MSPEVPAQSAIFSLRRAPKEAIDPVIKQANKWMAELKVPVVIEIMLERITRRRR